MAAASILFIAQIFSDMLILKGSKTVNPFLNNMLLRMQASAVYFFTVVVFVIIGYYVLFSA